MMFYIMKYFAEIEKKVDDLSDMGSVFSFTPIVLKSINIKAHFYAYNTKLLTVLSLE